MPRRPSPTTDIPITAPPEKAIERALFIPLSLAALAVLTFALVATCIPKKPASTEKSAPATKQIPVIHPLGSAIPMITKRTTAKITKILYSEVRNAIAPS